MTRHIGDHAGGTARSVSLPAPSDPLLIGEFAGHPAARHSTCQRCGFPVTPRAWGCKNPCGNCGTVYPLGDCSD